MMDIDSNQNHPRWNKVGREKLLKVSAVDLRDALFRADTV